MRISVIIPFYKELNLINQTVNSVLTNLNSFVDAEIIIINDGNFKNTEIKSYLNENAKKITKIISNRYLKGPGGARNSGLDIANGEIIAFLDADDLWLPDKLNAQINEIKKGSTFIATSYSLDKSNIIIDPPKTINNPKEIFLKRGIGTSTVLISKKILEFNRFSEIRYGQDIDFWFKLSKNKNFRFVGLKKKFVEYNTGGSTKNKWNQLIYLNKILNTNKLDLFTKFRVNVSYILVGILNHFIKRKLL